MPHISVVSPVYKAENIIDELVRRIAESVSRINEDFEIILVEDGSPDNSWGRIANNCERDARVKGIKLTRNFGQHYAITAGLDFAQGDYIVVMDCDLQDRPEEIINLYESVANDYDAVIARRHERNDGLFKKLFSFLFYKALSYLTGVKHDHTVANFGIYSKKMIDNIKLMRESIRYFPTMVKWIGYNVHYIDVEHSERIEGNTSYSFKKLIVLSTDIILAYSDKPLILMIQTGVFISFFSFLFAAYNIYKALVGEIEIMGFASLIVSVWLLSGIIIIILGVLGLYIGKTFEGVKNRPIYLINKMINHGDK